MCLKESMTNQKGGVNRRNTLRLDAHDQSRCDCLKEARLTRVGADRCSSLRLPAVAEARTSRERPATKFISAIEFAPTVSTTHPKSLPWPRRAPTKRLILSGPIGVGMTSQSYGAGEAVNGPL